jgi:hypothetical protein
VAVVFLTGAAIGIVGGRSIIELAVLGGGLGASRGFSYLLASLTVKPFLLRGDVGV